VADLDLECRGVDGRLLANLHRDHSTRGQGF